MWWSMMTQPEHAIFTIALLLMLMVGILELINLMVGGGSDWLDQILPDSLLDNAHDGVSEAATGGIFLSILTWLYIGRVPVLMWLVVFLTVFGVTGLALQVGCLNILGSSLNMWLAALIALLVSLPIVRYVAMGLHKILPKDETTAVYSDSFVGASAEIILGDARPGYPAQAKLKDQYGQVHYVMVEPDSDQTLVQGSQILLVSKNNTIFYAISKQ